MFDLLHQGYQIDSLDVDEMVHHILRCEKHVDVMLQWVDQNIGSLINYHPSLEGGNSFMILSKDGYDFIRQRSSSALINIESFELWKIVRHDTKVDNDFDDFIDDIFESMDKDLTKEMWQLAQQKHVWKSGSSSRAVFKNTLKDFINGVQEVNDPKLKDYVMFLMKDLFFNEDDKFSTKMRQMLIQGLLDQNDQFDILDDLIRNGLIQIDAIDCKTLKYGAQVWLNLMNK